MLGAGDDDSLILFRLVVVKFLLPADNMSHPIRAVENIANVGFEYASIHNIDEHVSKLIPK